uniref:Uncharacterized protein n=1 Tax=Ditylenchus dipsaci TaxID=166011 RepID=A0A915EV06_9BILA
MGGILSNSSSTDPQKKRKELEKKRRTEEDALNRKTDAENEVLRLERELDGRRIGLEQLRVRIISELCDLIRHCDLTTTACASHFFKSFSDLFAPLPSDYDKLAYAIRSESTPGAAFMSFLQGHKFPARSVSTSSLPRADKCGGSTEDDPALQHSSPHRFHSSSQMASAHSACSSSMASTFADGTSPSTATRRRNALNAEEHYDLIAETSHRRQKKSMTLTKCAQCDHYVVFDALKCSTCGIVWHKKCLNSVAVYCGPGALAEHSSMAQRRMSIFGVPLQGHLEAQHRKVPLILEKCIDELQKRGMTCKGLYRTCGVKSKMSRSVFSLSKKATKARRLPEPLMTFELYKECTGNGSFDVEADCTAVLQGLRDIVSRLPQQNYDTLKFLILHLKRVTWFELENLMTASNLAAVIAPSLIWQAPSLISNCSSFINDAHGQTKFVELLIQNAFEVFFVDKAVDWQEFFETYKDVAEPKLVDADMEADIELEDEGDELEEEEEYDICDEYTEIPSGSSVPRCTTHPGSSNNDSGLSTESIQTRNYVPTSAHCADARQPPDSVNSGRRQMESSSDDLEQDCNALPRRYYPSSAAFKKLSSPAAIVNSVASPTESAPSTPDLPRSDRKCAILPAKQHSVDGPMEGDLSSQRKFSDTARSYQRLEQIEDIKESISRVDRVEQKRSLCSGEVVVDIKKDQFCSPNYSSGRGPRTGKLSSASFNATQSPNLSTAAPAPESKCSVESKTSLNSKTRRRRLERSANNALGDNMDSEDRDQPYSPAHNNNNNGTNPKVLDFPTLQSVGVIFSGSDVSYV